MRIRDKINKKKVSHYLFNDEEIVCMNKKYFNNNYIHKDKIRDKIQDYFYIIRDCETILNKSDNEFIQLKKK